MHEHILLCGKRRSGRSALIRTLHDGVRAPLCGYRTETRVTRPDGTHEIYLYPYQDDSGLLCPENHVGDCDTVHRTLYPQVFDTLGVHCLAQQPGTILVMDEIGFMERDADFFSRAVLERMDGNMPLLAAVRTGMETPLLKKLLAHPRATVIEMRPERFDELYHALRPIILSWDRALTGNGDAS